MRTALYATHKKAGATIVDFHGWEMPIQYSSILDEHRAVRTQVGLFDLSHMGRVGVGGPDRRKYLQRLLTVDVERMAPGRCKYTFFLTERGTVIDDLIAYEDSDSDRSLLVVNASNREKDLEWMRKHAGGFRVSIEDRTAAVSLLALQGPRSVEAMKSVLDVDPSALKYYTFGRFTVLGVPNSIVSRTGYTGEDGFEIFVPSEKAEEVWAAFLARSGPLGLLPVGLGARDTLRTEAGMPLYGHELDEETTPVEAGLTFALSDKVDYLGRPALDRLRTEGARKQLVGFRMTGKRIARHGYPLLVGGSPAGTVTSGTYSPSLEGPIGMGYLSPEHASAAGFDVDIRGRREPATVAPLPFYKRAK